MTLSPIADTAIAGTAPQGAGPRLKLTSTSRALIRFDLGILQTSPGAQIQSARLELYLEELEGWPALGGAVEAYRLTQDWQESRATWNCAAGSTFCASSWTGGSFASPSSGSAWHAAGQLGWKTFDLTADVAAFLSGTPNFGWLLQSTVGGNAKAVYTSREGQANRRPRLIVTYLPDATPPSLALTAPGPVVLADGTPDIVLEYGDSQAGPDLATLQVLLDGQDIAGSCTRGPATAVCPTSLIPEGNHAVTATIRDRAGNSVTTSASFEMKFTVDHARAQAVRFDTSPMQPDQLNGLDSRGAIVWTSSPRTTWGYRLDAEGFTLERVDALGNRTLFAKQGNQYERSHAYLNAGTWTERYVSDSEGSKILQAVEDGPTDVPRKLQILGIAPGTVPAPATTTYTEAADSLTVDLHGTFGRSVYWRRNDAASVPNGVPYAREMFADGLDGGSPRGRRSARRPWRLAASDV